jgi:hypothetical protein
MGYTRLQYHVKDMTSVSQFTYDFSIMSYMRLQYISEDTALASRVIRTWLQYHFQGLAPVLHVTSGFSISCKTLLQYFGLCVAFVSYSRC